MNTFFVVVVANFEECKFINTSFFVVADFKEGKFVNTYLLNAQSAWKVMSGRQSRLRKVMTIYKAFTVSVSVCVRACLCVS